MHHAQRYGEEQAQMIVIPRSTEKGTIEKWVIGGRTVGIVSGAYSISSNHSGMAPNGTELGGVGWIANPEGELIVSTSDTKPFVTIDLDLSIANRAKFKYPRYVKR
ncbi:MAG: hypothetical protein ACW99A_06650 [Candidatus Kariarchaeaceae archaeon]|jgi:N-carbamoylputrescine amidase